MLFESNALFLFDKTYKYVPITNYQFRFILAIFFFSSLFVPKVFSQNFNYNIQLNEVSFHAPEAGEENWILIFEDPLPNLQGSPVIQPANVISGIDQTVTYEGGDQPIIRPAAYVSGSIGRVSAIFKTADCSGSFYIKGVCSSNGIVLYQLPNLLLTINQQGIIDYPPSSFNAPFPNNTVQHYENFTITWYMSDNANSTGRIIGQSNNPVYVTRNIPSLFGEIYHSLLYIGCKNAHGVSSPSQVVKKIYDDFLDRCVQRFNSLHCMEYWGNNIPQQYFGDGSCFTAGALLAYEDATCGAWADLFNALIQVQGISGSELSIVTWNYGIFPPSSLVEFAPTVQSFFQNDANLVSYFMYSDTYFFVKNWKIQTTNGYNNLYFPDFQCLECEEVLPSTSLTLSNGNELFRVDDIGLPGQGNPDPRSAFNNHAVVKYGGKYFDPSYGSPIKGTAQQWTSDAIEGLGGVIIYQRIENGMNMYYNVMWAGHTLDGANVQEVILSP
ncbi:MAG TPA: hypothetical protein PKA00_19610 [Saprospiraceae bacterium]|nr:hypothetical protein [Saprospiraceae bacterium]HMQ85127.1 hypothetical protein [Saprospiraceae bacterium]